MKSLLLVAHGSRREESNLEVANVAATLRSKMEGEFSHTEHAFLELGSPSIPDAIDGLVSEGADRIVILPYFLSKGRHVHEDIPSIIDSKRRQHSQVSLEVVPYLGEAREIIDVLVALSRQAE